MISIMNLSVLTLLPLLLLILIKKKHGDEFFERDYGTLTEGVNIQAERNRFGKYWSIINLVKMQVMILMLVYLRDYPGI